MPSELKIMKAKNISYPYPVLGNDDDVAGSFDVAFKHVLKRDSVILRPTYRLKNKTLERLIKSKAAAFTLELECPGTFFRKTFHCFESDPEFSVSSNTLREYVVVAFCVRATQTIPKYEMEGCHPDYAGFTFDIGAGDVLAIGGFTSFNAEKDFDPMQPAVSSLIAIKPGIHESGPMVIDYSQDKILIKLSVADYKNYAAVKGRVSVAGILHASIVLPVLADAIQLIALNDQELQNTHWYRRLEIILRQQSLPIEEPLIAAQKILRSPIERALAGLADDNDE